MKEKIWTFLIKWRFWVSLQLFLILILNIIGHIREGNSLDRIFGTRFGEAVIGFIGTILGFPSGIFYLFTSNPTIIGAATGVKGLIVARIFPAVYYLCFILFVRHIASRGKNYKLLAIGLLLFMLLSFMGCSRVVEIPLIIT